MDFSGESLQISRMSAVIDEIADNKLERVLIRCTSNEGFIAGLEAKVKVEGKELCTLPLIVNSGYGEATIYIPYGKTYTIEVQAYQGEQQTPQTFTADGSAREVLFFYDCDMAPLGVWIQSTDNLLISADDWATEGSGKTARGIAIITADHAFLVAKSNAVPETGTTLAWGGYATDVPGITNITNRDIAISDFDFVNKTTAIIAKLNPNWDGSQPTDSKNSAYVDEDTIVTTGTNATKGAPAAEAVRCYQSEDMLAGSWSLPTMGCLYLMYLNKVAVNAALRACGGTALTDSTTWSSTEYSAITCGYSPSLLAPSPTTPSTTPPTLGQSQLFNQLNILIYNFLFLQP